MHVCVKEVVGLGFGKVGCGLGVVAGGLGVAQSSPGQSSRWALATWAVAILHIVPVFNCSHDT